MTNRTEVAVSPQGAGCFRVEIRGLGLITSHTVNVPEGMADELGWAGTAEAELVHESFVFLLEREPPTSILRSFSLDVIGRYFPEYPTQMRRRLRGG
jgi:hypothetical protein